MASTIGTGRRSEREREDTRWESRGVKNRETSEVFWGRDGQEREMDEGTSRGHDKDTGRRETINIINKGNWQKETDHRRSARPPERLRKRAPQRSWRGTFFRRSTV